METHLGYGPGTVSLNYIHLTLAGMLNCGLLYSSRQNPPPCTHKGWEITEDMLCGYICLSKIRTIRNFRVQNFGLIMLFPCYCIFVSHLSFVFDSIQYLMGGVQELNKTSYSQFPL